MSFCGVFSLMFSVQTYLCVNHFPYCLCRNRSRISLLADSYNDRNKFNININVIMMLKSGECGYDNETKRFCFKKDISSIKDSILCKN